ncbi:MAG: GNAT family N-acetyltransferase [Candidatus Lokiarchaeia archaeon]
MFKYTIREPKDKEISKSINVLYSAFGRAPPVDIKEEEKIWKALINCEIGKFLISEEKGKVFGIGGVFTFEKVSSFGYMAVLQDYRGKGVGTEIFRKLLEIANKMNCETMILYASQLGEAIYKKFGFKQRFYGAMYHLPIQTPVFGIVDKEVKILNTTPDWMLDLDKKAMGFDRTNYINMRIKLGARILTVENEGYGLLVNKRLGPLIATNLEAVLQIINKSITLGADHMIIAKHQYLPKRIFELFNLTELENRASVKMVYGKKIKKELDLLYAIGTFAKG